MITCFSTWDIRNKKHIFLMKCIHIYDLDRFDTMWILLVDTGGYIWILIYRYYVDVMRTLLHYVFLSNIEALLSAIIVTRRVKRYNLILFSSKAAPAFKWKYFPYAVYFIIIVLYDREMYCVRIFLIRSKYFTSTISWIKNNWQDGKFVMLFMK